MKKEIKRWCGNCKHFSKRIGEHPCWECSETLYPKYWKRDDTFIQEGDE